MRTTWPSLCPTAFLVLFLSIFWSLPAHAQIIVNTTSDDSDPNPADGVCDTGTSQIQNGLCSFRAAIETANAVGGPLSIDFNIPGVGPHVIELTQSAFTPLTIFTAVEIDGYTQPGASPNTISAPWALNAQPMIVIRGPDSGFGVNISESATGTVIRGLVFQNFGAQNFVTALTSFADAVRIEGCFFGTDATGTVAVPNGQGLQISGNLTVIGGPDPEDRNLISGNTGTGLLITSGTADTVDLTLVQGNLIGTDISGTQPLGNGGSGISISEAFGTVVGGAGDGEANVIAANAFGGIDLDGTEITVQGNFIGTDAAITQVHGNGAWGILINGGTGHRIGGDKDGEGNIIAGTTNPFGTPGLGGHGIEISGNVSDLAITGNFIGTDRTGLLNLGNAGSGIWVQEGNDITIPNNHIAFNSESGVLVRDLFEPFPAGIEITQNAIYDNGGLGIDLGDTGSGAGNGVTLNDSLDVDKGPNGFQNFPVITSVSGNVVEGMLESEPDQTYRIEFFNNEAFDSTGFGEGRTFVGSVEVTTDADGKATFTHTLSAAASNVTATATNLATGSTSEFSGQKRFVVNATGDLFDLFSGNDACDTGQTVTRFPGMTEPECTLRAAIEEANALAPKPVVIHFDIPASDPGCDANGVCVIKPIDNLPGVGNTVTIDGYTQPGAMAQEGEIAPDNPLNATLKVVLDGSGIGPIMGGVPIGLDLVGDNILVRGLNIRGFSAGIPGAGNVGIGVLVTGKGNRVQGCYIGTNEEGTAAVANATGIQLGEPPAVGFPGILAQEPVIGGTEPNLISGNVNVNVAATVVATNGRIEGNVIGPDRTGEVALSRQELGDQTDGIWLQGTDIRVTDNLISGHSGDGLHITDASRIIVLRNDIGTSLKDLPLGNGGHGVWAGGSTNDVLIGVDPDVPGNDGNEIAHNDKTGVAVTGNAANVLIVENSIHDNGGPGIDLGDDGITPNDPNDPDAGPNDLQNVPVIARVGLTTGQTTVSGTLNSTPNRSFRIDVYEIEMPDDSGAGEGKDFLGSTEVKTSALGEATFDIVVPVAVTGYVTATATDLDAGSGFAGVGGPTSEFSAAWPAAGLEYGDAPETGTDQDPVPHGYPTTLASDGARHEASVAIRLGDRLDPETDGKPALFVDGDDLDAGDDDDGILFGTPHLFPHPTLGPGTQPVPVLAPGLHTLLALNTVSGYLNAWADFNRDGDWDDPDEHIIDEVFVDTGPVRPEVPFTVPDGVADGLSALRVRFTTVADAANTVTGVAPDGEVEDYLVRLLPGGTAIDYGDAPDDRDAPRYPTLLGATLTPPAAHILSTLRLGEKVDGEADGQPDDDATGDGEDDDGVTFTSPLLPGQTATVEVTVSDDAGGSGYLNAWLDVNRDDDWDDPGEQIITDETLAPGTHTLTFTVPDTAQTGKTYARFRLDPQGGLGPAGLVFGGEVEDYAVTVGTGTPVEPAATVPDASRLYPNYPNPFALRTTIPYDVATTARVSLDVYDLLGRRRLTLVDGVQPAGHYEARLDASGLAAGVYLCRLRAGAFTATRPLTVLK